MGQAFDMGIDKLNVAEIVPIALREHVWPASRIISIAIKLLRKKMSWNRVDSCLRRYRAGIPRRDISSVRVRICRSQRKRAAVQAQGNGQNSSQPGGVGKWLSVPLWTYPKSPTHRRVHNHREHGKTSLSVAADGRDENHRREVQEAMSETRRK